MIDKGFTYEFVIQLRLVQLRVVRDIFTMEDDLHQIWTSLELRLFHVYPMIDVIYRCSCQQKFANALTGCGLFYQSCTSLCAT